MIKTKPASPYISRSEAARRLGVSHCTVERMPIPRVEVLMTGANGKQRKLIRYTVADVEAFLAKHTVTG